MYRAAMFMRGKAPVGYLAAFLTTSIATASCKSDIRKESNTSKPTIWSWGSNAFGQLGQGHEKDVSTPTSITIPESHVHSIAAGGDSSAFVTSKGEVFTFGAGGNARLGHGDSLDTPNLSNPQLLSSREMTNVSKVAIGEYHMAAITADHRIWTWGKAFAPQLGHEYVR